MRSRTCLCLSHEERSRHLRKGLTVLYGSVIPVGSTVTLRTATTFQVRRVVRSWGSRSGGGGKDLQTVEAGQEVWSLYLGGTLQDLSAGQALSWRTPREALRRGSE